MNTIVNTVTQKIAQPNQFILDNTLEIFQSVVVKLKIKAKKEGLTSTEHLFYNLVRGLPMTRGFSTLKEENTQGYLSAKRNLLYNLNYVSSYYLFEGVGDKTLNDYKEALEV